MKTIIILSLVFVNCYLDWDDRDVHYMSNEEIIIEAKKNVKKLGLLGQLQL